MANPVTLFSIEHPHRGPQNLIYSIIKKIRGENPDSEALRLPLEEAPRGIQDLLYTWLLEISP